jgi:hypothetical protein
MPFDLNITFAGLCAFAFDSPVKGGAAKPTDAIVLMPKLLQGELTPGPGNAPDFREAHFPQLIYPQAARVDPITPAPDLRRPDGGMELLFLYVEDLAILPDGNPQAKNALQMDNGKPASTTDPSQVTTAADQNTLFWLTALTDAFPTSNGKVDPVQLNFPPSLTGKIIAKIAISQGTLTTARRSSFPCTFSANGASSPSSSFNQLVAIQLKLTIPIQSFVDFRLPTAGKTLRLTAPGGGNTLDVTISNIEIDDFVRVPSMIPQVMRHDIDFATYFGLSTVSSSASSFPHLIFGGSQSLHHGLCPPAAFVR